MTDPDRPTGFWRWLYRGRNLFAIIEREPTTLRGSSAWHVYLDGKRDSGRVFSSSTMAVDYACGLQAKGGADGEK